MAQNLDIFLRAYAVAADNKKEPKRRSRKKEGPKWPKHALVFDTETRITADQSLTFGVYRLCKLVNHSYELTEEGLFYADDLPKKDIQVLNTHLERAIPDVRSFPPRFPLYSRTNFMQKVFWPAIKYRGALICGLNLPFDLARLALAWNRGEHDVTGPLFLLQAES